MRWFYYWLMIVASVITGFFGHPVEGAIFLATGVIIAVFAK
jgi:hypothetical protein